MPDSCSIYIAISTLGTIGVEPYHGNSRSANMQSTVISINTIRQPDSIASILQTKPLEPQPFNWGNEAHTSARRGSHSKSQVTLFFLAELGDEVSGFGIGRRP